MEIFRLPALRSFLSGEYSATEASQFRSASLWSSLYSPGADPTGNIATNISSVVVGGCLAIARILLTCLFVYLVYLIVSQKRSLYIRRLHSSVSICHNINYSIGWTPNNRGSITRESSKFSSSPVSRLYSGVTQPPFQWVPGALSSTVELPERETRIASSAKSKNSFSNISTSWKVVTIRCSETSHPFYNDRIFFFIFLIDV